jgi:hypothetical protein
MAKNFNTSAYSSYPIGFRNNNPGNLRTGESWQGAIGSAGGFVTFKSMAYGIRAAATVLVNNVSSQGNNTIRKLITKYAPPSENNTTAYINAVSASTGIAPDAVISLDQATLVELLHAIFEHENGATYAKQLTDADILEGIALMSNTWLHKLKSFLAENPNVTTGGGVVLVIIMVGLIYAFIKGKIKLK